MKFDASYTSVVGDLAMQYGKLESFYLDVITSAGSTYKSFDIDMVVPYMNGDNDQQIAKICTGELVYAGKYASCAKKHIFNKEDSLRITYENRYYKFCRISTNK